jgi:hypothetical protein
MRRVAIALAGFAFAAAFYLLLVDTTSLPELAALVVIALLAAIGFEASREQGFPEARISASWLAGTWRAFARVPFDSLLLVRQAVAQLLHPRRRRGRFRTIPFADGDTERDRGRFAMTEIVGSLAPNTIVIGIDADSGRLVVHQLEHKGDADELDVLGLR